MTPRPGLLCKGSPGDVLGITGPLNGLSGIFEGGRAGGALPQRLCSPEGIPGKLP